MESISGFRARFAVRLGLAVTMLAGMAATAHAVFLNPGGLGQALVYPYYTVNGNNITLLTLINSSNDAKAIKVRFLEGYNGRDVLDFNLYLAASDVWAGAVVEKGGGAALFSNDDSCTVPQLPSTVDSALAFSTANFNAGSVQGEDTGPTGIARTREGHVEVVEMGTVTNTTNNTQSAITRAGTAGRNCAQVATAWESGGYWSNDARTDIGPATGGLFGGGTLVNVPLGTVAAYNADALAQFYAEDGIGEHSSPEALTSNIASGTSMTAQVHPDDKPINLIFSRSIDAVSAVFMASTVFNEYWTGGGTAAGSEWVITFPTKRFYVDPYYVGSAGAKPFVEVFGSYQDGVARAPVAKKLFDRKGVQTVEEPCAFLKCPEPSSLSYETQVISFRAAQTDTPSGILASNMSPFGLDPGRLDTGWARLDLYSKASPWSLLNDASGEHQLLGKPVTGFWVTELINGNARGNGVLANYTALFRHKTATRCVDTADGSPCS